MNNKNINSDLLNIFAENGILQNSQNFPNYRPRIQQLQMANMIDIAIKNKKIIVIEAATGTGKTLSYLIPAILSGKKIIISTGTKTLQDQLVKKDLPLIAEILNINIKYNVLKGRANYVCWYHLNNAYKKSFRDKKQATDIEKIRFFINNTESGDKAECFGISENSDSWNYAVSTAENCLNDKCEFRKDCFLFKARDNAIQADIVVVNHHLFLSDLVLQIKKEQEKEKEKEKAKEKISKNNTEINAENIDDDDDSNESILPNADIIVFDEAHQLPDLVTKYFSNEFVSLELDRLSKEIFQNLEICNDEIIQNINLKDAALKNNCFEACENLIGFIKEFLLSLNADFIKAKNSNRNKNYAVKLDWNTDVFQYFKNIDNDIDKLKQYISDLIVALSNLTNIYSKNYSDLRKNNEPVKFSDQIVLINKLTLHLQEHFDKLTNIKTLSDCFKLFDDNKDSYGEEYDFYFENILNNVLWMELKDTYFKFISTPLNTNSHFHNAMKINDDKNNTSLIFTSATLNVNDNFKSFCNDLGLNLSPKKLLTGAWNSPFDFHNNSMLYLPSDMPEPNAKNFYENLVEKSLPILNELSNIHGGTFILCTSKTAVDKIHYLLSNNASIKAKIDSEKLVLYKQGEFSKNQLLTSFVNQHKHKRQAVLIATMSFWEGVDIVGAALSCVIIDKIPFAIPDDPILKGKERLLQANNKNSFNEIQIPQAIITLKQGVGRLIRGENDKGVLMIADPRLLTKNYGKRILNCLPNMQQTQNLQQILTFIQSLKK